MIIGIPREVKQFEFRVAMTPVGVRELALVGHQLLVERGAGKGAGWEDREYRESGARIVGRRELFGQAEMVVKVKEPQRSEGPLLREGQILFAFLHLAGYPPLIKSLGRRKIIGIGYETVQTDSGDLPLLAPMSEIAGKIAVLLGANYLRKDFGGKGCLLSGIQGQDRGHVTVVGGGHAGEQAALIAHGLGASVTVLDINADRLSLLKRRFSERFETVLSTPKNLEQVIRKTDLLIGAVLVAGRRAPRVVTKEMVRKMEAGSVIIDISIDQGGCVETSRITTHKRPVFLKEGIVHSGVDNLPSLFPRSASEALSRVTFPYVKKLADLGFEEAVRADPALKRGVNLERGRVVLPALLNV